MLLVSFSCHYIPASSFVNSYGRVNFDSTKHKFTGLSPTVLFYQILCRFCRNIIFPFTLSEIITGRIQLDPDI